MTKGQEKGEAEGLEGAYEAKFEIELRVILPELGKE